MGTIALNILSLLGGMLANTSWMHLGQAPLSISAIMWLLGSLWIVAVCIARKFVLPIVLYFAPAFWVATMAQQAGSLG